MSTIVWDGKTLAADRQTTWGTTATLTRKAFKVTRNGNTFLFGCAGLARDADAYVQWALGEVDVKPDFSDFTVMCIDSDRRIWIAQQAFMWTEVVPVGNRFWAIGSGCDYALGALYQGASAKRAVEIASKLDTNTGFGVDTVTF